MANRIILKKSVDEYGNEKHAYELIKESLFDGEKRFGEIRLFLADHKIKYADDKGLDLALKSLIKRGEIGKHKVAGISYPVYYLKKKGLSSIAVIAQEFQRGVVHELQNFLIYSVKIQNRMKSMLLEV